jgi:gluconolactonase
MRGTLSMWPVALLAAAAACGGSEGAPDAEQDDGLGALSTPDSPVAAGAGSLLRLSPRFGSLVPPGAVIEKVADGFTFIEGPVWIGEERHLLFSDVRGDAIYRFSEGDSAGYLIEEFFGGSTQGRRTWGPNGLTRDAMGRLVIADQGRRQITRIEADGGYTALATGYDGMRFNSPNDVVYRDDGWLYFTDPPYGLESLDESPLKELPFNGIYRLSPEGEVELLYEEQARPNGLAFSPDQGTLYVANSDASEAVWMAYDVSPDGLSSPRVFFDATGWPGDGVPDGLKVDRAGNLFATGPAGVWVIAPDGEHLGIIQPQELPANVGFADDGRTLYMTARTGLYRIRLSTEGAIP